MNIYVGNLAWEVTEDDLRSEFAAFGEVASARLISDRMTGRSRGFGFVTLTNEDDSSEAIAQLNGRDMGGRNIVVNEARERQDRDDRRGGGR